MLMSFFQHYASGKIFSPEIFAFYLKDAKVRNYDYFYNELTISAIFLWIKNNISRIFIHIIAVLQEIFRYFVEI